MTFFTNFLDIIKVTCLLFIQKWFNFSDRANRREYISLMILIHVLSYLLFSLSEGLVSDPISLIIAMLVLAFLVFIPDISVTVRRLHDFGASGWWYLVLITLHFIWFFLLNDTKIFLENTELISNLWLVITNAPFAIIKGTPEPNRFGNEPEYAQYTFKMPL